MATQSVLWKIIVPNKKENTSYLLGTIHIAASFVFTNIEVYKKSIQSCTAYAGETNLDDLQEMVLPGQFSEAYLAQYQQYLSTNQFRHLEQFIEKQLPFLSENWFFLHPMLLLAQLEASFFGNEASEALDLALWSFASKQGKTMVAIEPASLQHQIFENFEIEASFAGIKKAIKNLPAVRKKYRKLAQHYQNEDIQALYKKTKKELGKLKKAMIYDRNLFMADRIEEFILEEPTFISIGVGHLSGKYGVLRYLKQKGFRLQPLRNELPITF